MTQTLDAGAGFTGLGSAPATASPAATKVSDKAGTFAITFGIAFATFYTVFERLNWPLFTYVPRLNTVYFWQYMTKPAEGPPMFWYGWIVLAIIAALVVSVIAMWISAQTLHRASVFVCALSALWPACFS